MHLREMMAEATDDETGIKYELSRSARAFIFEVTKADGTRRKQVMLVEDLVSAWAVAIAVDEERVTDGRVTA